MEGADEAAEEVDSRQEPSSSGSSEQQAAQQQQQQQQQQQRAVPYRRRLSAEDIRARGAHHAPPHAPTLPLGGAFERRVVVVAPSEMARTGAKKEAPQPSAAMRPKGKVPKVRTVGSGHPTSPLHDFGLG